MKIAKKIKENWFSLILIALNFFISYMGTYYFAHNLLEVNKFIEAIIIGTVPVFSSIFLSAILTTDSEKMKDYFHLAIIPILIAEKIGTPLYEYIDAKIHDSFERNFGVTSELDFFLYLLQGKIGSAYYYNGVYILTTIIVIWGSYRFIKWLPIQFNRNLLWVCYIYIHSCTVPVVINLFTPLFSLSGMLIWILIGFIICFGYGLIAKKKGI